MTRQLHLLWFGHQPFFITDDELLWRVYSSYLPMIDALTERRIPFTLCLTGAVLMRLASLAPWFVELLKCRIDDSSLSLAGTAVNHPVLPWLSTNSARAHIEEDKRIRGNCGFPPAKLFWPTELAWSMRVGNLARDAGYQAVVIDRRCSDLADLMPAWTRIDNVLVPETKNAERANRYHLLTIEFNEPYSKLDLWVRDGDLAHCLIHILRGDEHDERRQLFEFLEALDLSRSKAADPNEPILLADDIERVLPDGLARFLDLLDGLLDHQVSFCSTNDFAGGRRRSISYVPAGTMEGGEALWDSSADDRWFREHLQRLSLHMESRINFGYPRDALHRNMRDRLLRIQDSGFYFWRYVARSRRPFYDELFQLESWLERGGQ